MSRLPALLLSATLWASAQQGGITGSVRDQTGSAIPDATITLFDTGTGEGLVTTTSRRDGSFVFTGVAASTYRLRVDAIGFRLFETKATVKSGDAEDLPHFVIELAVADSAYTIGWTQEVSTESGKAVKPVKPNGFRRLLRRIGF